MPVPKKSSVAVFIGTDHFLVSRWNCWYSQAVNEKAMRSSLRCHITSLPCALSSAAWIYSILFLINLWNETLLLFLILEHIQVSPIVYILLLFSPVAYLDTKTIAKPIIFESHSFVTLPLARLNLHMFLTPSESPAHTFPFFCYLHLSSKNLSGKVCIYTRTMYDSQPGKKRGMKETPLFCMWMQYEFERTLKRGSQRFLNYSQAEFWWLSVICVMLSDDIFSTIKV